MHIKKAELGYPDSGGQHEPGTGRKLRLGGSASRVPVQTPKKVPETPLRALVSAIGQSLSTRTPLRGQPIGSRTPSSVKSNLFSSAGKPSSTTPADGPRSKSMFASEGRTNGTPATTRSTGAVSVSRVPSTPKSSRAQAIAGTPSKMTTTPKSSWAQATERTPSQTPATPKSSRAQATAGTPSKIPATPKSSRAQATAGTPSNVAATPISTRVQATTGARRSSLSSSSSSSNSNRQSISSFTPTSIKTTAFPSIESRKLDPTTTPVSKKSSIPPRSPKHQNNPTTPSAKPSYIPLPTPRRPPVSSTVGGKQASTPQSRSKNFFPTTPVSKHTSVNPFTPVQGDNYSSTPSREGANQTFYTPTATLPLTPLQPRNFNVPESSRKLQFGINVAEVEEQENVGSTTPRPAGIVITEATFSFDKNKLARIKARKNSAQLLQSPAQRIRVPDRHHPSHTPGRGGLQQVVEDRSLQFDQGVLVNGLCRSPAKRRVANSLF